MPETTKENLIVHQLKDYLRYLAAYNSLSKLKKSLLYKSVQPELDRVMNAIEYGFYSPEMTLKKRPFYRIAAWNLAKGIQYDGILDVLQTHSDLCLSDVLLCPEIDLGMARSSNRNVACDLAKALGWNYAFSPAYLNLCHSHCLDNHFEVDNLLGLQGNAIFSKYPMGNLRIIPLLPAEDKMRGQEKKLGCQKAVVADILFPYQTVTVVCVHLDDHSSQRQRAGQMKTILTALERNPYPVVMGGDMKTSGYNSQQSIFSSFDYVKKILKGMDNVIENHHLFPERHYDRLLFEVFKKHGFDFENYNELGQGTWHYDLEDLKYHTCVEGVFPKRYRQNIEKNILRNTDKVSLKLDWFAAKGLGVATSLDQMFDIEQAQSPRVIGNLKKNGVPLSDHDAIAVDIDIYT